MAWEDFLDHKCTIYHIVKSTGDLGYGVTDENAFRYPDVPEEKDTDIPCHFAVKSGNFTIGQDAPLNLYGARIKLSLPAGTDVRINDKIVSAETGFSYIAELPRNIRNHHMIVYLDSAGEFVKDSIAFGAKDMQAA